MTSESPNYRALYLLLLDPSPSLPSKWDFATCSGRCVQPARRCLLRIKNGASAESLYRHLRKIRSELSPENEQCHELLQQLFQTAHCGHHYKAANAELQKWKARAAIVPSLANQTPLFPGVKGVGQSMPPVTQVIIQQMNGSSAHSMTSSPNASHGSSKPKNIPFERVEEIIPGISNMAITTPRRNRRKDALQSNIRDDISLIGDSPRKIPGFGWASRRSPPKDSSPVLKEARKPLIGNELKTGLVYVLQVIDQDGWFKIGWTEAGSAKKRLKQANNCNKDKTEIIFETVTFRGAYRAEKIVHAALSQYRATITNCSTCLGTHRECFKAPRERIIETVLTFTTFVKRTYDETGELTSTGNDYIRDVMEFDSEKLRRRMEESDEGSDELDELHEELGEGFDEEADEESDGELDEGSSEDVDGNTGEELDEESEDLDEESDDEFNTETLTSPSDRRKTGAQDWSACSSQQDYILSDSDEHSDSHEDIHAERCHLHTKKVTRSSRGMAKESTRGANHWLRRRS